MSTFIGLFSIDGVRTITLYRGKKEGDYLKKSLVEMEKAVGIFHSWWRHSPTSLSGSKGEHDVFLHHDVFPPHPPKLHVAFSHHAPFTGRRSFTPQ